MDARVLFARCLVCTAIMLAAWTNGYAQSSAQPTAAQPTASQSAAPLKPEELEQLAAPVALYPDPLLAQVLMAATYPLEVVTADRWLTENKNLKPEELKAQAEKKGWDKSVVALVATPEVLKMMSEKLDWTQQIGDALLAQQADLMDAVQRLRSKAKAQNKLETTKQQIVSTKQEQGKELIVIEPAEPETIYVPYYDPAVVYGAWPFAAYPPYFFPWPGYIGRGIIAAGIGFGAGYALGRWTSGGNYWGGSFNWGNNNININRPVNINNARVTNFDHNPAHRHGVKYRDQNVQQKFANRPGGDANQRLDFRGRDGQQVVRPDQGGPDRDRPGGDRPDAGRPGGDRPGGDRPGAGQRPGGDRPSGGDRPQAGQRPAGGGPQAGQRPAGGGPQAGQRPAGGGPQAGQRPAGGGPQSGQRPSGPRGGGGDAFSGIDRGGGAARAQAARGQASFSGGGGGGGRVAAGGGGGRGGGGRGGGGGGRRSDVALKHDVMLLGHLDNGLGYYRFSYHGSDRAYVGVMAQEVQAVMPAAIVRGRDGYLRVHYDKLGVRFQTYEQWIAAGARVPAGVHTSR